MGRREGGRGGKVGVEGGVVPNRARVLGGALPEDGGRGHQGHGGIADNEGDRGKKRIRKPAFLIHADASQASAASLSINLQ